MRFLTLLFLLIVLLISCSESKKISTILKDSQCGTVAQKQHIIVNGVKEWDALYKNILQIKPLINISERELGVFIFLGERSSSGYSLDFIESYTTDKEFIIVVNEVRPKKLDPVLTVMTYPCIGLMIPKTDKEIKIIFREFK